MEISTHAGPSGLATNSGGLTTNSLTIRNSPAPYRSCEMAPSTPKEVTSVRPALRSAPMPVLTELSVAVPAGWNTPATCSAGVNQDKPVPNVPEAPSITMVASPELTMEGYERRGESVSVLNVIEDVALPMRISDVGVEIVMPRAVVETVIPIDPDNPAASAALRFHPFLCWTLSNQIPNLHILFGR